MASSARGKHGVVERLHVVERRRQPPLPPLRFGREAPRRREGLEVGELGGSSAVTAARTGPVLWTQSPTVLWKWRTRISWSFSGKSAKARDSRPSWVPSSVPASCSAYSLTVMAAYSRASRSRAVVAGANQRSASNTWVLCDVGQNR